MIGDFLTSCRIYSWLAAAIAPAILGGLLTRIGPDINLPTSLGMAVVFYPYALIASGLLGGPVLYFLYKMKWENFWTIVLSATIISLLILPIWAVNQHNIPFIAYGPLNASLFWILNFLCIKRRGKRSK